MLVRRRPQCAAPLPRACQVRFIDPTYMIRTTPCNALDHIYARILAHNAVDAAFSGGCGHLRRQARLVVTALCKACRGHTCSFVYCPQRETPSIRSVSISNA